MSLYYPVPTAFTHLIRHLDLELRSEARSVRHTERGGGTSQRASLSRAHFENGAKVKVALNVIGDPGRSQFHQCRIYSLNDPVLRQIFDIRR